MIKPVELLQKMHRFSKRVQDTVDVGKGQKLVRLIPDLVRKGFALLCVQELGITINR